MAQKKVDGVIEAVRYAADGRLELARVYERRGPTYSDRLLLSRPQLIERLKAKKPFYLGRRMPYLASTFDVSLPVRLVSQNGVDVLVAGEEKAADRDHLPGAPLF